MWPPFWIRVIGATVPDGSPFETGGMPDIVVPPSWRDRLEELVGRRRDVWLIALVVVVVAFGAFVLRSRAAAPKIAPPATAPPAETTVPGASSSSPPVATTVAEEVILVHVAGAVRRPGLYEMPAGARIADAIELARGPQPAADLDALNLAEPLVDGQKIDVPKRGQTIASTTPATAPQGTIPSTAPAAATVNLNTADQVALEAIPGIGPVTASAILAYRTEVGRFDSIEQLLEITGIGPATLESMRPYITL